MGVARERSALRRRQASAGGDGSGQGARRRAREGDRGTAVRHLAAELDASVESARARAPDRRDRPRFGDASSGVPGSGSGRRPRPSRRVHPHPISRKRSRASSRHRARAGVGGRREHVATRARPGHDVRGRGRLARARRERGGRCHRALAIPTADLESFLEQVTRQLALPRALERLAAGRSAEPARRQHRSRAHVRARDDRSSSATSRSCATSPRSRTRSKLV